MQLASAATLLHVHNFVGPLPAYYAALRWGKQTYNDLRQCFMSVVVSMVARSLWQG